MPPPLSPPWRVVPFLGVRNRTGYYSPGRSVACAVFSESGTDEVLRETDALSSSFYVIHKDWRLFPMAAEKNFKKTFRKLGGPIAINLFFHRPGDREPKLRRRQRGSFRRPGKTLQPLLAVLWAPWLVHPSLCSPPPSSHDFVPSLWLWRHREVRYTLIQMIPF